MSDTTTADIIAELGFNDEIDRLRAVIDGWIAGASREMQPLLDWQFVARSKYFRPLTIFSCHRAISKDRIPDPIIRSAAVLEMMHNVSLIIDDILDESDERRGKATLHKKFGLLPALMASGYIAADGYTLSADDPYDVRLFSDLLKRLGVAECAQWRLRRQPLGLEDWQEIASEDTGSMFETCACLATRDERLRKFGHLLGVLYHGCDDVGDVKGLESLGGGGEEDLRDGILTLPASLAIRDPAISALFCKPSPTPEDLSRISLAMRAQLPAAEAHLDQLAAEAKWEAHLHSADPGLLLALVDHTRELSRR
ncbi:polyprenyl synthetase family protein [Phenylobacterium sp.]|uniref:polyprenyl synthetase family protein n=1 Tax=Phenylobacterium sp. TaxID=1871053 RepID=UPI00286C6D94|nr:polyprenyl synthetase family protein [Phenylobacterium sp.]